MAADRGQNVATLHAEHANGTRQSRGIWVSKPGAPHGAVWFNDYRSKIHAVPLSGLGDQAFYDGYASVSVLKGDAYIRIAVVGSRGTSLAAEKKLAADALPRM